MAKPKRIAAEAAPYDTESRLRMVADGLSETFESLTSALHGNGEHGSQVADIARISTALTTALAELRQHTKARARELSTVPIDQIVTYLKGLPERTREDICREVSGSDDEEPLL